jgi:hypothetical protein
MTELQTQRTQNPYQAAPAFFSIDEYRYEPMRKSPMFIGLRHMFRVAGIELGDVGNAR